MLKKWSQRMTLIMKPKQKGKQINGVTSWLHLWGLHEQVFLTDIPYHHFELAHYRDYIMQQDRKLMCQAIYIYDIQFRMKCAQFGIPLNSMDHGLVANILDVTAVKSPAHNYLRCNGYDDLVGGCPFPPVASLKTHKMTKAKGAQVRQGKPGPSRCTTTTERENWYHSGKEGCNNYQLDKCTFPWCN